MVDAKFTHVVDIHSHLLPGLDDGSSSWQETLAMAQMAVAEGISTMVVTPHQLGNFAKNTGDQIRERTTELQRFLQSHQVPLNVLPGGDVRIEPEMMRGLQQSDVLTLADRGRHVLLELPHEIYFPLEPVLEQLGAAGYVGILSHPERNHGLQRSPEVLGPLVDHGCLMQVTAGSLTGLFGQASCELSKWMLNEGLVHVIATDAHGCKVRRPRIQQALRLVAQWTDSPTAQALGCQNPQSIVCGQEVAGGRRRKSARKWARWFQRGRAA